PNQPEQRLLRLGLRICLRFWLWRKIIMRKLLSVALVAWFSLLAFVPTVGAQEPVDREMNARIREEGLKRSKVYETFTHFTEVIGPRLTGTPAHKTAAEYARDRLREWGLPNPRLDSWEFGRGWTLEKL